MESGTPHNPSEEQRALRAFKDSLVAVWSALERTGQRGEEMLREARKAEEAYARVREFAPAHRLAHEEVAEFLDCGQIPDRRTLVFFLAELDYDNYLKDHLLGGAPPF